MTDAEEQELFDARVREYVRGLDAGAFEQFVTETRPPAEPRPGDAGRAAAARRHGQHVTSGPGAGGRAAAARRHPERKD